MQLTPLAYHPTLAHGGLRHHSDGPRRSYGRSMQVCTSPTMGYYRLRSRSGSFLTAVDDFLFVSPGDALIAQPQLPQALASAAQPLSPSLATQELEPEPTPKPTPEPICAAEDLNCVTRKVLTLSARPPTNAPLPPITSAGCTCCPKAATTSATRRRWPWLQASSQRPSR